MTNRLRHTLIAIALFLAMSAIGLVLHGSENPVVGVSPMLVAASAENATGTTFGSGQMSRCRESAIYVQWSAGTSAGVVTIETAHESAYTGTWAPLTTATWDTASSEDIVQVTGVHGALRTRISTAITGGTVSSWLSCN